MEQNASDGAYSAEDGAPAPDNRGRADGGPPSGSSPGANLLPGDPTLLQLPSELVRETTPMRRRLLQLLGACVVYLVIFGFARQYMRPLVFLLHPGVAGVFGLRFLQTDLIVAVAIGVVYTAVRLSLSTLAAGLLAAFAVGAWAAFTFRPPVHWLMGHPGAWGLYTAATSLMLALTAAFFGQFVAAAFKDKNLVAAGAAAGAIVDIWGVYFHGSTHQIITQHPHLHQMVSVAVPQLPMGSHPAPLPLIGPGDYIFIGIMLALTYRFNLRPARTAVWMWLFTALALVLVANLPGLSIPGIVGMALAVILPNRKEFKFSREESIALIVAGSFLLLAAGVWWLLHSHTAAPIHANHL